MDCLESEASSDHLGVPNFLQGDAPDGISVLIFACTLHPIEFMTPNWCFSFLCLEKWPQRVGAVQGEGPWAPPIMGF